jgi:ATP-dependent RNA helicase DDX19/DBP5
MLPRGVQNVLFSATFPDQVQDFADKIAPEANKIFLKKEEVTVDAIKRLGKVWSSARWVTSILPP